MPVVTSSTTSIPEVVGENAGVLVDPRDDEAIAEALRCVLSSETMRKDLGQRGRNRAQSFGWESTAQLTWQILEQAAMS